MRWIVVFVMLVSVNVRAQNEVELIRRIMGIQSVEEADADQVEVLMDILRHPLELNFDGKAKLESSGLFTPFQLASLEDYVTRHGSIMSLTELSSVDGFSWSFVRDLAPFISLEHVRGSKQGIDCEVSGRTSFKKTEGSAERYNHGLRARMSVNGSWGFSIACSKGYDDRRWLPSAYSGNFVWNHRYGMVVVGDFNARYGQGLCMWNTVSFSYLSSPSTFMRRASGLTPSYSYTGTYALSGMAADFRFGKWKLSCILAAPDIKSPEPGELQPAVSIIRHFDVGHVGFNHMTAFTDISDKDFRIPLMRSSADASLCLRGVNVFGEAMFDWVSGTLSCLTGAEASIGESLSMAALVRCLPSSDEHGAASSAEVTWKSHDILFAADVLYHPSGKSLESGRALQAKFQAKWKWAICDYLSSEVRLSERLRSWGSRSRTDARIDIVLNHDMWKSTARFDVLKCVGLGLLGYIEAAYIYSSGFKVYLRQGIFRIDNWDDRIYVYERDAPSSFNVPAFSGRGIWTSSYLSWRFAEWGSLYLRASYTAYPMMKEKKKPGSAELKFQFALHF